MFLLFLDLYCSDFHSVTNLMSKISVRRGTLIQKFHPSAVSALSNLHHPDLEETTRVALLATPCSRYFKFVHSLGRWEQLTHFCVD